MTSPADRVLQHGIAEAIARGWRVESSGPGYAVMVSGRRFPDWAHLVLILVTCGLWIPVWIIMHFATGERRAMLTVQGNRVVLSKMTRSA